MRVIKFGKYSGFKKAGTVAISKAGRKTHLLRASWLTAQVESGGKFGTVINYDGTGMTAGIHQAIAVYPRALRNPDDNNANDQGPLWRLLRRLQPLTWDLELWGMIERAGWRLGLDNVLRNSHGDAVNGRSIRHEFTGHIDGRAALSGPARERAESWVQAFHQVFVDHRTFEAQESWGLEHFAKRASRAKFRFCKDKTLKRLTMDNTFYDGSSAETETFDNLPEIDLALCMYWSHSVNAPSMALKVLCKSIDQGRTYSPKGKAANLIKRLGNTRYGRWDDDIKNGRYQRTRRFAMKSKFWPSEFFTGPAAIMPADLPG